MSANGRTRLDDHVTPALIDSKAAGRLLAVPPSWIEEQARRDAIPHVRLGRYVRFDPSELDAWWRARARGPWRDRGTAARAARRARAGTEPIANDGKSA
jgi:excisionase family DNA binding protein